MLDSSDAVQACVAWDPPQSHTRSSGSNRRANWYMSMNQSRNPGENVDPLLAYPPRCFRAVRGYWFLQLSGQRRDDVGLTGMSIVNIKAIISREAKVSPKRRNRSEYRHWTRVSPRQPIQPGGGVWARGRGEDPKQVTYGLTCMKDSRPKSNSNRAARLRTSVKPRK